MEIGELLTLLLADLNSYFVTLFLYEEEENISPSVLSSTGWLALCIGGFTCWIFWKGNDEYKN